MGNRSTIRPTVAGMARNSTERSTCPSVRRSAAVSSAATWAANVGKTTVATDCAIRPCGSIITYQARSSAARLPSTMPEASALFTPTLTCTMACPSTRGPISRATSRPPGSVTSTSRWYGPRRLLRPRPSEHADVEERGDDYRTDDDADGVHRRGERGQQEALVRVQHAHLQPADAEHDGRDEHDAHQPHGERGRLRVEAGRDDVAHNR